MLRAWLVVACLALTACGQSAVGAAPVPEGSAAPLRASAAARAPKFTFVFDGYARLSAEERRLLEASAIAFADGAPLSGRALYDHLAASAPKLLANYLNQTAVLERTRLANGRTIISYLERVDGLKINHLYAQVDPQLKVEIERQSARKSRPEVAYVGPEDSSLLHGHYDTSFRENRAYTSQQFAFSERERFTKVDIDLDEECPLAGDKVALAKHLLRAAKHEVLRKMPGEQYGESTEPDDMFRRLSKPLRDERGRASKIGRGIRPNYQVLRPEGHGAIDD